jgi:hydrogenase maturation protease
MTRPVRVLACGAADRGDDAAGLLAACAIPLDVRVSASVELVGQLSAEQLTGDPPDILRVVVDCIDGVPVGELVEMPLAALPDLETQLRPTSSHALPLGQTVAMAALLDAVHPQDRFIGIGGDHYQPGSDLSDAVSDAIPELTMRLVDLIERAASRRASREQSASSSRLPAGRRPAIRRPRRSRAAGVLPR